MTVSVSKVALVGSACRLPSAHGLDAFWDVLINGRCTITELDESRFGTEQHRHPDRNRPGRAVTFAAGQLERPFAFDTFYFGISPREATAMDPQQRILLEVAVEALENAGIPADSLAGEEVGVYVGASSLDYGTHAQIDTAAIEPQSMTGNTLSIIANRLSYIFDLRGPSYVVDTACSSSLIALHQAIEDIRSGRIDTAIVGGVSMLLHPVPFIGFSRASMLSANGRCRAFDAGADGYVRSEGAVAMVLRAEHVARENKDPIRARFVGSGINADGRTTGLSLPSMDAQAALLRKVYEKGEIDPNALAFVEAHGTGTRVGDPIESEAIGRVLGVSRNDPLLIGSVKTNFGHLEPASGLVGVLKSQLALANDTLPASLFFDTPNPDIRFKELNLEVAGESRALGKSDGLRLVGVNSFGFGGANAHVVLADGDPVAAQPAAPARSTPLVISAASKPALQALAGLSADALDASGDAGRYANAAAHRRQRLAHRAVIAAGPAAEMSAALKAVETGKEHPLAVIGEAAVATQKPVFCYSGNGSQWAGMGRTAYQNETDFRLSFDRTDRLFMSVAGWSLVTMLFSEDLETEIERTEIAQPLLFALQVAMTEALARQGLTPSLVVGHSVGEVAAAWACGALSLSDAVKVIHARSTHQEVTRHLGGMAALLLPAKEAQEAIAPYQGLELAAINSSRSVTISGPTDTLADFAKAARQKRWAVKRLDLDYPFHCALVEPIRDPLLHSLESITPRTAEIPMISTVTGALVDGSELDGEYWWKNVRQPVHFADAIIATLADHRLFVEIGPRPVLLTYINDASRGSDVKAIALCSFRQNDTSTDPVGNVVRSALANGSIVDDVQMFGPKVVGPDLLPVYPWQHEDFRTQVTVERVCLDSRYEHPLLGRRYLLDDHEWRISIDHKRLPFLADHKVEAAVVFPAAGFSEMLLAVGRIVSPGHPVEVRDLDIFAPLVLDNETEREVRTREVSPNTYMIESRPRLSEDGWTPHVKATVGRAPAAPENPEPFVRPEGATTVPAARLYEMTTAFGLPYGPVFRRANLVTLIDEERAHVRLAAADPATARYDFALDPTLFDSTFHALFAFLAGRMIGSDMAVLPIRLGRIVLAEGARAPVEADITVRMPTDGIVEADFVMRDAQGDMVATASAVRFQAVPLGRNAGAETIIAAPLLKRITRANEPATVEARLPKDLVADGGVEPSETALLIEAGVQAAAAEALRPLLGEPARLSDLAASGTVAANALPLVARFLMALEASGNASESEEGWTVHGDEIEISDVVSLLIAEHPERLAEAAFLSALPGWLSTAFHDGLPAFERPLADALMQQLVNDGPFAAPIFAALVETARATLDADGGSPVRLCVLGAGNISFLRKLSELVDPALTRIVISDRDEVVLERARLLWEKTVGVEVTPFADLGDTGHPFDAIVLPPTLGAHDLKALASLTKPGGALIAGAFAPSLFADAVGGLQGDWWAGSSDAESPVGRLIGSDEWPTVLAEAGFEANEIGALAAADTDALIVTARRMAGEPSEATFQLPHLHAVGDAARKMCVALSAMQTERPDVHELTVVGDGPILLAIDEHDPAKIADHLAALGTFLAALGEETRSVTIVTFGAQVEGANEIRPTAAALSAFCRVALNEFPHLDMRLVDVADSFDASEAAVRVFAELAEPNAEREIVLSSDHRAAMRYVPAIPAESHSGDATVLAIPRRGSIDHLEWQSRANPALQPGEVRMRVEATGLNFRDVMWTLGLLPHEALQDGFAGPTLGMECSGVIEAVGEGVTDLVVGDPVIAFAPACFASHVTVRSEAVAKRPALLDAPSAATIPVAFLTAYYALVSLGGVEEGETVLIHGGAGGVGLAALQIAKWRGARVFATAGTTEKRALLEQLGADEVFDSRSLTFADEALKATGGEGVDVVLNSLAGEAMERSIATLKPFGRFLELGKRDFYADTKLGLRPFRQNLSYFGIDADQLMKHRAKLAKRLLTEIIGLFETGDLTPLPYRRFAPEGIRDAFRLMQHAGHIGKIVVTAPEPIPDTAEEPVAAIDPDKAYLLVGGTSGFAFATAEWLIGEGARHLVLASRSGVKDEAIAESIEAHRKAGVEIDVAALDVTDKAAVSALVGEINGKRPLGGVFHMAMVLDDALITSLDAGRYKTVLDPKIAGVIALEAATADIPLDLFVVYSSITVQLGNPGQANYVAANAFLEAIARRRRAEGKPALAVAWGAIADRGVLARDMQTNELLQRKLGRHAVTAAEALAKLKRLIETGAMTSGPAMRMVGKVDWMAARKDLILAATPTFEDLADDLGDNADDAGSIDLAKRLKGLTDAEAMTEVTKLLAGEISRILKLPASEVDVHKPLTALGMDSLMGVELRMAAEQRLGIDIPLMSLAAGATLSDLARKVVQRGRGGADEVQPDEAAEALISRHLGSDGPDVNELGELESAVREKTAGMRTII
ncbi:SDR family NAD(P)-dependent oxidoreductase [Acuticoccus sp. M5D2P5]|uniref:type I polyketide synthase n=1 Tax=Acuticoccus kalidii TaxID=2910977 RepID=UPI001F257C57|nr:type I polyketide synthase [Acuticoccus kalidii]MCF3935412.1 SDR family NAD(P)-dependent oxidoreductase [Acuticoccus kalidii]